MKMSSQTHAGGRTMRAVVAVAVAVVPFVAAVPVAWAGLVFGVTPAFPANVTVGQIGLPAAFQLQNMSTQPESGANLLITAISLVPSCATTVSDSNGDCPITFADPGVFRLSATAFGEPLTACAGQTFNVVIMDPITGQVAFQPVGSSIELGVPGTANSICRIDFTFDVVKSPTRAVGTSLLNTTATAQIGRAIGSWAVNGNPAPVVGSSVTTVTMGASEAADSLPRAHGAVGQLRAGTIARGRGASRFTNRRR